MNVLSLFDGMSCGQQALERANIVVDNYFASEIDKYAIQVTMANYPDTKQLGSVVNVDGYSLPKIDLLIGGSPCQSFSFAGKRKGMATKCETQILTLDHYLELKNDGFEFEGQSYLFWEFMRLLYEVKPKYFLLENVEMGEKWEKVLSKAIGVNGIHINSALVSAQNRKRIYWTNIGLEPAGLFGYPMSIIRKPKDKKILLKDILESDVPDKYYLSAKSLMYLQKKTIENKIKGRGFGAVYPGENEKSSCIDARYGALRNSGESYIVHNTMPRSSTTGKGGTGHLSRMDGKTYCLDTGNTNAVEINVFDGYNSRMRTDEKCGSITQHCSREGMTNGFKVIIQNDNAVELVGCIKFGRTDEAKEMRKESMKNGKDYTPFQAKEITGIDYDKMNTLTTAINKDNLVAIMLGRSKEWGAPENSNGKSYTLCKEQPHGIKYNKSIRRLTPTECERLQTVADNYTNHVSDSQRYKMLGNGWTVDVIKHIFGYIK